MVTNTMHSLKNRLPRKPYCADDFSHGIRILPEKFALEKRYIQLNTPAVKSFMVFDIDRHDAALAAEDSGLPPPTFIVINPKNHHAHVIYALSSPVCVSVKGREKPKKYLKTIERAYAGHLGADPGYCGLLAKNPWHGHWDTIAHENAVYDLATLAAYVNLSAVTKKMQKENAKGRNCTLFDRLRFWAYRNHQGKMGQQWENALMNEAQRLNDFQNPLPYREVKCIAKSVFRWTCRQGNFSFNRQRQRALKRWSRESKRQSGIELIKKGLTNRAIAEILEVSQRTLTRWRRYLSSDQQRVDNAINQISADHSQVSSVQNNRPAVVDHGTNQTYETCRYDEMNHVGMRNEKVTKNIMAEYPCKKNRISLWSLRRNIYYCPFYEQHNRNRVFIKAGYNLAIWYLNVSKSYKVAYHRLVNEWNECCGMFSTKALHSIEGGGCLEPERRHEVGDQSGGVQSKIFRSCGSGSFSDFWLCCGEVSVLGGFLSHFRFACSASSFSSHRRCF